MIITDAELQLQEIMHRVVCCAEHLQVAAELIRSDMCAHVCHSTYTCILQSW